MPPSHRVLAGCAVAVLACPAIASAATIDVVADDSADVNIAKIEGAVAGDEVVVHPGTYKFRLYLEGKGTDSQPIVIRAADPADRPVWDLDGQVTADWPGSYEGGDSGRGIWQVTGSHYLISGIVFQNGTDGQANGSGLRLKSCDHVTIHDCLFDHNDNGIQGAGDETVVQFSELAFNGDPSLDEGSHNLYIHGGTLVVRYSYIHDATQGQNLHIRANDAVLEYNWIARSTRYMGDMMPCTIEPCAAVQHLLLRGNVFLRGTPTNDGQEFVLYNDQGTPGLGFELTMIHNTFVESGDAAALVHFVADTGDVASMSAVLRDNVIAKTTRVFRVDGPANLVTTSGANNWIEAGASDTDGLTGSIGGSDPGFTDAANGNLVPAAGSPLIGAASAGPDAPDKEYYRDEKLPMMWRARASVSDVGAFESTTDSMPEGPYGPGAGSGGGSSSGSPAGSGGDATSGNPTSGGPGAATGAGAGSGSSASGASDADPEGDSGCACATPRGRSTDLPALGLAALALLALRRRGTRGTASPQGASAAPRSKPAPRGRQAPK